MSEFHYKIRIEITKNSNKFVFISITSDYLDVTSVEWKLPDINFEKFIAGKICLIKVDKKDYDKHRLVYFGGSFDDRGDDLTKYIGSKETGMGVYIFPEEPPNAKTEVILTSVIIGSAILYLLLGNIHK